MAEARIGPNAVLQYLPVIEAECGAAALRGVLRAAGLAAPPSGDAMIPQGEAARLHRAVRRYLPGAAPALAAAAGRRTGAYLLAHRIPRRAQRLMRALPPALSARLLARAIEKHAWTFAGSGRFIRHSPWRFEIRDNPIVAGERSDTPLCHWHAAVFSELYQELVAPDCVFVEVQCGAQPGKSGCIFEAREMPA